MTSAHWAMKQLELLQNPFQTVNQMQQQASATRIQCCHWFHFMRGKVYA